MEMDRQTIMVFCAAVIGLTLFGGIYLASPKPRDTSVRHAYAQDDIRYKFQQEDLKKPKTKKNKPAAEPVISSSESSGGSDEPSDDESNEEPSLDDGASNEEPSLD